MKVQTIMQQIAGGVFMGKVITIAREFGSGGRIIAQSLAEQLKIGFYDKNLITLAAERKNLPEERLERVDERRENPWRYDMEDDIAIQRQFYYEPLNDVLFEAQSEIIKEKAETEDCVIVGRCADYALEERDDVLSVFIHADLEDRIKNVAKLNELPDNKAKDLIHKTDKRRASYYNYYTNKKWGEAASYELCLNSSELGVQGTAKAIEQYILLKESIEKEARNIV